ncbi:mechanosensitive ion channel MscS [candidate division SR1 bacterium RAAC1_SR1_1]|nr:mechanosensitive ion channel MscS [candidate division SR1 bacterium RAAC1_SR1_1]
MAAGIVGQAQQLGQTTVETSVSFLENIYENPYIHGFLALIFALALSFGLITISKILSIFVRNRITKNFAVKDGVAPKKMGILIGDLIFYLMSFLSIYIAFTIAGIDIKLLMSGITIGVGFAFRQTLSNMISGVMIFSTSEYKIGNIVQLRMEGDVFGIIEEINMKNIMIRTFDMRRVIIPNSTFLRKAVKTYSAEEFLRIEADVVVDVNLDIPLVIQETLQTVNAFPFILNKEYTQVLLDSFDDKKAKITVQMFFNPNSGYSSEYIKSLVQIQLLTLYKKLDKDSKALAHKEPLTIKESPQVSLNQK